MDYNRGVHSDLDYAVLYREANFQLEGLMRLRATKEIPLHVLEVARKMLMSGPKAQEPSAAAVMKTARLIGISPIVQYRGTPVPFVCVQPAHGRGSWRASRSFA